MAQLQWRDVAAPNLGVSLEGIKTFADMLGGAFEKADAGLTRYDNTLSAEANQGLALDIAAAKDTEAAKALVSSLRDRPGSSRFSTAMIGNAAARPGELTQQAAGELGLASATRLQNRVVDRDSRNDAAKPDITKALGLYANNDEKGARDVLMGSAAVQAMDPADVMAALSGGIGLTQSNLGLESTRLGNAGSAITNDTGRFNLATAKTNEADRQAVASFMGKFAGGTMDAASAREYIRTNGSELSPTQLGLALGQINALHPGTFGSAEMAAMGVPTGGGAAGAAGGNWTSTSGMANSESGGRWNIVNGEGYGGRNQFGNARLADAAAAGILPRGTTSAQFARLSPEKQMEVENWHWNDIDRQAESRGLNRYIGQTIGGVKVTPGAIRGMAQIGGVGGALQFLQTGGRYNPRDSNRTSISDYGMRFSGAVTAPDPRGAQQTALLTSARGAQDFSQGVSPGRVALSLGSDATPNEVAAALAPSFPGVPQPWLVDRIREGMRSGAPNAAVAGDIIERHVGQSADTGFWNTPARFRRGWAQLWQDKSRTPNLAGGRRIDDDGVTRDLQAARTGQLYGRVDAAAGRQNNQAQVQSALANAHAKWARVEQARSRGGMEMQLPGMIAEANAAKAAYEALLRSTATNEAYMPTVVRPDPPR